ncbi:RNA-directed DNA polymerase [Tanacetum coccineum]
MQQQSQQLQQQSQQHTEQSTKILEALQNMNIREQPKRDNSRYGSSSDEDEEGDQADPTNNQRNRMPRIKVDIPTFSGSLNIEDILDWVSKTEKYFELMDIPEDSQVKYVAYKLRRAASSWWDSLQTSRRHQRKQPIRTWRKMKIVMFVRFLPVDYGQTLYSLYQNCRQSSRTVTEYAEEFMRLVSRNQLRESDAQQVARFNKGLRYDIQAIVSLQTTWTIDEAVRIALKAEQTIKKQGIGSSTYTNKTDTNQSSSTQLRGDAQVDHSKSTHEVDGGKKKTTTTTTSTHATSSNNPSASTCSLRCLAVQEVRLYLTIRCRATKRNVN